MDALCFPLCVCVCGDEVFHAPAIIFCTIFVKQDFGQRPKNHYQVKILIEYRS